MFLNFYFSEVTNSGFSAAGGSVRLVVLSGGRGRQEGASCLGDYLSFMLYVSRYLYFGIK